MQYNRQYKSLTWSKYTEDDQDKMLVKVVQHSACTKFDSCIRGMKNYSSAWITGSTKPRSNNMTM